jgi:enoyl-[acyl-carrier protein] reductase I
MLEGVVKGQRALVTGVANKRSIAWAIAQALHSGGAELAFTYQGERLEGTVRELAGSLDSQLVLDCDVTRDDDLDRVFQQLQDTWDGLDILVHSIAFAGRENLEGRYIDTPRADFLMSLDISSYSLVAMARRAEPLMEARGGGSILTMTYHASERVVPNYNVMAVAKAALECSMRYLAYELGPKNIRVNAISAGIVRTLAARAIGGFTRMEDYSERAAPLRRNIEAADVGAMALFLLSPLAKNVTGDIVFVDAGMHALAGFPAE